MGADQPAAPARAANHPTEVDVVLKGAEAAKGRARWGGGGGEVATFVISFPGPFGGDRPG